MLHDADKDNLIRRNQRNYEKYGYSPLSLDWNKGKQDIRFEILTSMLHVQSGASVVDVGCGFGDLLPYWRQLSAGKYIGVDIVQEFIEEARQIHKDETDAQFLLADFLSESFLENADFFLASGTFNYMFENTSNYKFIENSMKKAFAHANAGLAFNFLSDKVDWKYDNAWYSNPSVILEMAYGLSRNVCLRNDYMPFEFSVAVFKDDSFSKEDTLFNKYKHEVTQKLIGK